MDHAAALRALQLVDATVDAVHEHLWRRLGTSPDDELIVAVYLAAAEALSSPEAPEPDGDPTATLVEIADRVVDDHTRRGGWTAAAAPSPTTTSRPLDDDRRRSLKALVGAAFASETATTPHSAPTDARREPPVAWPLDAPFAAPPDPPETRRALVLGASVIAALVGLAAVLAAVGVADTEPLPSPTDEAAGPPPRTPSTTIPAFPDIVVSTTGPLADGQRLGISVTPSQALDAAICVRGASDLCAPLRISSVSDPAALDFVDAVSIPRRFVIAEGELVDCALMSCDLHLTPVAGGTIVFPLTFDPDSPIAGPIRALASPPPPWTDGQQVVFDFAELTWLAARQCVTGTDDCWTDPVTGLPANATPPGPSTSAAIRIVRFLPIGDRAVDCLETPCEIRLASIYFPRPIEPVAVTIDPRPTGINGLQVLVGPTAPLVDGQGVSIIARRASGTELLVELCHGEPGPFCQVIGTTPIAESGTVVARIEVPRFTDDGGDCVRLGCILRLSTDTQQVVAGLAFEP